MTSTNPWMWANEELVSFNLVRDRSPVDLLRLYDADPTAARTMTRRASDAAFGWPEGTVLRAGRAGTWSFCIENWWLAVGFDPGLLEELSVGTDTVHYFRNPKGGFFVKHLRDGRCVESFELGLRPNPFYEAPLGLHRAAEQRAVRTDQDPYTAGQRHAFWEVLSELVGVRLDSALVNGPLLTVLRPSGPLRYGAGSSPTRKKRPAPPPPVRDPSRRGLGKSLGPLIPPKPHTPHPDEPA
ncbi:MULTISPECIES: DUF6461 domain-containing protein [unclassified Streptomyces]|uniref:DUF6461 domain-containing protein n=1 Tax=unclassified Streptomyces TaxID=2593676 RepID=UPI000F73BB35|nr:MULTISPECIES: DUF6461 domain-containing protein [unclassified Streptomyces]